MGLKYHINPKLGVPSICRAKNGKCRHGGPEEHYDSFEVAQKVAQERIEAKYMAFSLSESDLLKKYAGKNIDGSDFKMVKFFFFKERRAKRAHEKYMEEKDRKIQEELEENKKVVEKRKEELRVHRERIFQDLQAEFNRQHPAPKLDPEKEIGHSIATLEDPKALLDIIDGVHYPEYFSDALQNPNLPQEFIDKVIDELDRYTTHMLRFLVLNPNLKSDHITSLIENDDIENDQRESVIRMLAAAHENIDYEYAKSIIENNREKLNDEPYVYFFNNPSLKNLTDPLREDYEKVIKINSEFLENSRFLLGYK